MAQKHENRYGLWTRNTGFNFRILFILAVIETMVSFSPLGFIKLSPISFATGHIIVMLAAMWGGPAGGGLMGLLFGLCSMWQAEVVAVNPSDIIFAPVRNGTFISSVTLCIGSRVLYGVLSGVLFSFLFRKKKEGKAPLMPIIAVALDRLHSALVYIFISVLFGIDGIGPIQTLEQLFAPYSICVYIVSSLLLWFFYQMLNSAWGEGVYRTYLRANEEGINRLSGKLLRKVLVIAFIALLAWGMLKDIRVVYDAQSGNARAAQVTAQGFIAVAALIMLMGEVTAYQIARREIERIDTERALAEKVTEANAAAERAERARTAFLNNLSNDMSMPINAILGTADIIRKESAGTNALTKHIDKVQTSAEYLLSFISNILETSSIRKGETEINESIYDMDASREGMIAIFEREIEEKRLKIAETMEITHRYVYADSAKIRQIWLNLIGNAVRYTAEGGTISIDTTEIPCDKANCARFMCKITVSGAGGARDMLPNVFDAISKEKTGLDDGLGMSIAKTLVELMDGTLDVYTDTETGTSIAVTLTHRIAKTPKASGAATNQVSRNSLEGITILLAEDNDINAEIAESILNEMGINVERAKDGMMAVDMLRRADSDHYDLILMDIEMPGMDGYTATDCIRDFDNKRKARIPIIAMTSNTYDEDKRRALNVGMDGHIAKPINVDRLREALEIALK